MPSTRRYAIAAAAVAAAVIGAGAWMTLTQGGGFAECGGGVATGAAQIGGPFTLIDETGAAVSDADVIDRPALVYFGYTFCPDVCPVDAAVMAQVADLAAADGRDLKTVFITIDPERDRPEILADFTDNLHPDMLGLTGTADQIAAAADAYKVFHQRAPGDDPEFYLMDHSAFTYLMAPGRGFLQVYRHGEPAEAMANSVNCYLDALAASGGA